MKESKYVSTDPPIKENPHIVEDLEQFYGILTELDNIFNRINAMYNLNRLKVKDGVVLGPATKLIVEASDHIADARYCLRYGPDWNSRKWNTVHTAINENMP